MACDKAAGGGGLWDEFPIPVGDIAAEPTRDELIAEKMDQWRRSAAIPKYMMIMMNPLATELLRRAAEDYVSLFGEYMRYKKKEADEIDVLRRRDKVLRYIDEHSRTRQPCAGSSTDKGFLWEIDLRVFDDRPRSDMHLTVSGSVGQLMDEEEAASGPPQG